MSQPVTPGVYPQPVVTAPKNGQIRGQNPSVLHSIAIWGNTSGTSLLSSRATIDAAGNFTTPGTFNGRRVETDGSVLDALAAAVAARLPTQNEKSALVGTDGTPSGLNPFVTDSDPRLSGGGGGGGVPSSRQIIAGAGLIGGGTLASDVTVGVAAHGDGSIVVNADNIQVGILASDAQHGVRGGGTLHALATPSAAGFMSAAMATTVDYWINVLDHGADPTGVADSWAAFTAAMNAIPISGAGQRRYGILVPPGLYTLSRPWMINRPVQVRGANDRAAAARGVQIQGRKGFDVARVQYTNAVISGGAAGSIIEGLRFTHQSGTSAWQASTGGYVANQSAVIPTTGYSGHWDDYALGTSNAALGTTNAPFVLRCIQSGTSGGSEPTWSSYDFGNIIERGQMVRVSNTVSVTTLTAHGKTTGNSVYIMSDDPLFASGFYTITVTGASTFTYTESGADATSGTQNVLATVIADGTTAWMKVYVAGLKLETGANVKSCTFSSIGGDGVAVVATVGSGIANNANGFRIEFCRADNSLGWGFATRGSDANAGGFHDCFAIVNGWGGFIDASELGNTYVNCGVENNGIGRIDTLLGPGIVVPDLPALNSSVFFGSYLEGGQRCLINSRAMFFGGTGGDVYGSGNILNNSRCSTLYFLNDTNDDGTGDSAYTRVGRIGSQNVLEFGFSQNTGGISNPIAWGYGVVNGTGIAGWHALGTSLSTNIAYSLDNATDTSRGGSGGGGAGQLWIPNDLYRGPAPSLRMKEAVKSSGPPSSGSWLQGDRCIEVSPQVSGMAEFHCYETGTPGSWAGIQSKMIRTGTTDYTAPNPKEFYYGFTSLSADTTYTLPTGAGVYTGLEVVIKDESGSAGSPYQILVAPGGSDTIDGSTEAARINSANGWLRLIRRGTNWQIIEQSFEGKVLARTTSLTLTRRYVGTTFHNTGATGLVTLTLPASPQVGDWYAVNIMDSDGVKFLAQGSHVIRNWHDVSATAGFTSSTDVGASLRIEYLGSNTWFCKHLVGTWTTT